MRKRLSVALALFALCLCAAVAQTQVKGVVTGQDDGQPIMGASVLVVGTQTGVVTDADGAFTVKLPKGRKKLRVSYLGMVTIDVEAKPSMKIALQTSDNTLDEVVVTAMGIKRAEKAIGFSATSVKGDEISAKRTNDVMSSLAGKVAGVQIASTSSDPGASNSVIIRGASSLSGTNQPLYVIDGVPLQNNSFSSSDELNAGYDFGNGANAVNPDDVDNMTILKGAAATALYGSRAANGVVLITTKSGKRQEGIGVEYNGGLQCETVLRLPQLQNDFGMGWYGEKTDIENGSWGPRFDGSQLIYGNIYNNSQNIKSYLPIKDNVSDFFDTGIRYSNSLSLSGASHNTTFFTSFSQIHEDGIIPTDADSYNKYTFSFRGTHRIKKLTISVSANYAYQKNNFVSTGQKAGSMYNCIMQTPRDISLVEMKDLGNPFNNPGYYYTPYGVTNPYYVLENYKNEYEQERFYGKFQADYDILPCLKLSYWMGLDTSTSNHAEGQPNLSSMYADSPNWADCLADLTGSASQYTQRRREIDQNITLNFQQQWGDYGLNAVAGFNGNERRVSYVSASVTNLTIPTFYNITNSAEIPAVDEYFSMRRLMGIYGQVEASWRDMAYLTVTARNDWSSTLPKGNRSFFYPGLTGSFIFSKLLPESWRGIVDFGKVRLAWGKTGNDANTYMTSSVYAQAGANSSGWGSSAFPFNKGNWNAYSLGNVLGSQNLSPEMTTEIEAGLNMAFLKNRFSFDITYYRRDTDKQIFSLAMDPATGYTAQNMNLGKIRNHGIELLVNGTPIKTKDFQWDLTLNFTKNYSKVVSLPEELGGEQNIYGLSGGTGLYAIVGKPLGVFKAYTSQRDEQGHIIVDDQGLPKKTDDLVEIGDMNYKYQMGIGTTLTYKGISLAVDFDIRQGGLMYSRTADINYFVGNAIQTAYNSRNPWIIPGSVMNKKDEEGIDIPGIYIPNTTALNATNIYNYWDGGADNLDASFLIDKSYVKLRSVVLAWDLPKQWLKGTFLQGVKLSLYGNNLFVWAAKSNTFCDPELTSFGNDLAGNYGEWSANPSCRKFGFNLNVKF